MCALSVGDPKVLWKCEVDHRAREVAGKLAQGGSESLAIGEVRRGNDPVHVVNQLSHHPLSRLNPVPGTPVGCVRGHFKLKSEGGESMSGGVVKLTRHPHPLGVAAALLQHRTERLQFLVRALELLVRGRQLSPHRLLAVKGRAYGEDQRLERTVGKHQHPGRPRVPVKGDPRSEQRGLSEHPEGSKARPKPKPKLECDRNEEEALEPAAEQGGHRRDSEALDAKRCQGHGWRGALDGGNHSGREPNRPAGRPEREAGGLGPEHQDGGGDHQPEDDCDRPSESYQSILVHEPPAASLVKGAVRRMARKLTSVQIRRSSIFLSGPSRVLADFANHN